MMMCNYEVRILEFGKPYPIIDILRAVTKDEMTSSSYFKRLIEANAVSIDDQKIINWKNEFVVANGMLAKIGKHKFYRIKLPVHRTWSDEEKELECSDIDVNISRFI